MRIYISRGCIQFQSTFMPEFFFSFVHLVDLNVWKTWRPKLRIFFFFRRGFVLNSARDTTTPDSSRLPWVPGFIRVLQSQGQLPAQGVLFCFVFILEVFLQSVSPAMPIYKKCRICSNRATYGSCPLYCW